MPTRSSPIPITKIALASIRCFLDRERRCQRLSNAVRSKAFKLAGEGEADAFELKYRPLQHRDERKRTAGIRRCSKLRRSSAVPAHARRQRSLVSRSARGPSSPGRQRVLLEQPARSRPPRTPDRCGVGSKRRTRPNARTTTRSTSPTVRRSTRVFNQARKAAKADLLLWGNIEEHIATQAGSVAGRLSIFNGPVFRSTDRLHRGLAVPREFWKIVVHVRSADTASRRSRSCSARKASSPTCRSRTSTSDRIASYQVKVREIEARTKLDFGELRSGDPLEGGEHEFGVRGRFGRHRAELARRHHHLSACESASHPVPLSAFLHIARVVGLSDGCKQEPAQDRLPASR